MIGKPTYPPGTVVLTPSMPPECVDRWLDERGVPRGARPPKRLFPIWPRPERHVRQPPYLELDGIRRSRQPRRPWVQEELPW